MGYRGITVDPSRQALVSRQARTEEQWGIETHGCSADPVSLTVVTLVVDDQLAALGTIFRKNAIFQKPRPRPKTKTLTR